MRRARSSFCARGMAFAEMFALEKPFLLQKSAALLEAMASPRAEALRAEANRLFQRAGAAARAAV